MPPVGIPKHLRGALLEAYKRVAEQAIQDPDEDDRRYNDGIRSALTAIAKVGDRLQQQRERLAVKREARVEEKTARINRHGRPIR